MFDDPEGADLPEMFSWLSNQIDGYPDTLSLKMYAHIQEPSSRPIFELEPTGPPSLAGTTPRHYRRTCKGNHGESSGG